MSAVPMVKREVDVVDQIAKQGFAVVASPGVIQGPGLAVAHTVGMAERGLPEIILEGISGPDAIDLVGSVASFLVDEGVTAEQIDKMTLTVPDMTTEVFLMRVQSKVGAKKAPLACRDGNDPDFVQVCLRDRSGKWPWEPGFQGSESHRGQIDGTASTGMH